MHFRSFRIPSCRCAPWLESIPRLGSQTSRGLQACFFQGTTDIVPSLFNSVQVPSPRYFSAGVNSRLQNVVEQQKQVQQVQPKQPHNQSNGNQTVSDGNLADLNKDVDVRESVVRLARNEFGDDLPDGVLSEEELNLYKRLYGEPRPFFEQSTTDAPSGGLQNQDQDQDGKWSKVKQILDDAELPYEMVEEQERLQDEEDSDPKADDEDGSNAEYERTHPFTLASRFGTSPSTIQLPQSSFVKPVARMLSASTYSKQYVVATERIFGGPGLPYSPSTPSNSRTIPQKPVPLAAEQTRMSDADVDAFVIAFYPQAYASLTSTLVEVRKRLGRQWLRNLINKPDGPTILDAGSGGAGILAWRDVARAEWDSMQEEKSELPFDPTRISKEEADQRNEGRPMSKATVVTGSDTLRRRAANLLDSTSFIPRLPEPVPAEQSNQPCPRKQYDVILASYSLWRVEQEHERKHLVQTLWTLLNPQGGVLILLEKGVPRGFEVIAGAREHLLKCFIQQTSATAPVKQEEERESKSDASASAQTRDAPYIYPKKSKPSEDADSSWHKELGTIIAPCTNHKTCPLYTVPGISKGRKDYCRFTQRYIRPPFLQDVLRARRSNFGDVEFSYIAVQRGIDHRCTSTDQKALLQDDTATDRAFAGYGKEERRRLNQGAGQREAGVHETSLGQSVFGDMDAQLATHVQSDPAAAELEQAQKRPAADPPHPLTLPRLILPPLKRKGHIVVDVCTPSGTFERWLVNRHCGKQTFRDARKSKWGDLWALGAKSREPRRISVGKLEKKPISKSRHRRGLLDSREVDQLLDTDD